MRNMENEKDNQIIRELHEDFKEYPEEYEEFKNTHKDDLILYHSTLGRYIRNTYIFCEDGIECECPDEWSFSIIQKLHDRVLKESTESTGSTERENNMKENSYGVAIVNDGKVLMVQSGWDQPWGLPKGKIEPGETIAECACRELQEELGVCIQPSELDDKPFITQANKKKNIGIFLYDTTQKLKIKPNNEIYTYAWFDLTVTQIPLCKNQSAILEAIHDLVSISDIGIYEEVYE